MTSKSKLDSGEVRLELNDNEYILKPTVNAIRAVSRQYGGIQQAMDSARQLNFDTLRFIVGQGAGLNDKQMRKLDDDLFKGGLLKAAVPVVEYLMVLANGGKPLADDDDEDQAQGADSGNS